MYILFEQMNLYLDYTHATYILEMSSNQLIFFGNRIFIFLLLISSSIINFLITAHFFIVSKIVANIMPVHIQLNMRKNKSIRIECSK